MTLPKKTIYTTNVLLLSWVIFTFILFGGSIIRNYKKILTLSHSIEKKYDDTMDQYKKIAIFILKNNLPQDINYFNSTSNTTYNLPSVKQLKIIVFNKDLTEKQSKDKMLHDEYVVNILGCHNNKCIRVSVDKQKILSEISKNDLWRYGKIKTIPFKKSMLFKTATGESLDEHKIFIFILLMCFCILYLSQSIILFIKYFNLIKINNDLSITSNKNEQDLITKTEKLNKLYDILPFVYALTDEYFAHYAHKLISRNAHISDIDLVYLLQKVEKFLAPQIIKKDLKITLDGINCTITLKSDNEILFAVLLNLMFKSISRAKISSEIMIKLYKTDNAINIEINDCGYKYQQKNDNKIKIYMLPDLFLENLCRKIKIINIKELRNGEINSIIITIMDTEIETLEEMENEANNNNRIKIKIDPIWL